MSQTNFPESGTKPSGREQGGPLYAFLANVIPLDGTFEMRFQALSTEIDEKKGKNKPGWTTVSGMIFLTKKYGHDVVQAMIDSGRLGM
jgi:hypothetical protein